jgi:hypothetical protein
MNPRSHGVRLLIGLGSVASFVGGWVLLAHAPKPVANANPTSPVIASPDPAFRAPGDLQPFRSLPNAPTFFGPRLRTHGS